MPELYNSIFDSPTQIYTYQPFIHHALINCSFGYKEYCQMPSIMSFMKHSSHFSLRTRFNQECQV